MRPTVCIVLNERETPKARAAEALESTLRDLDITSSRAEITEDVEDIILARKPDVLVLDYLLGDYSTGLNILLKIFNRNKVQKHSSTAWNPAVYFLTDEPSVQVAVEAMKLGAINYFELDNPQSISRLARDIKELIRERQFKSLLPQIAAKELGLDDLVCQSKAASDLILQAKAFISKQSPLLIIFGPAGSGKTTLAKAICKSCGSQLTVVDLRTYFDDPEGILRLVGKPEQDTSLPNQKQTLLLEQIEQDTGDFLKSISLRMSGRKSWSNNSEVIVSTSDLETFNLWTRTFSRAEIIKVPSVEQRKEDIAPLAQKFIIEASELSREKVKGFTPELLSWLSTLEWKGQIKQLRSVIFDAVLSNIGVQENIRGIIEDALLRWHEGASTCESFSPSALTAARTLEICNYNFRLAAAYLGITPKAIQAIIYKQS